MRFFTIMVALWALGLTIGPPFRTEALGPPFRIRDLLVPLGSVKNVQPGPINQNSDKR